MSWLDPYKDKKSQDFIRLLAQIIFAAFTFILGSILLAYGFSSSNNVAITMGSSFIGAAIGTWVGSQ